MLDQGSVGIGGFKRTRDEGAWVGGPLTYEKRS